MLQTAHLVAKISVDTGENEPSKVLCFWLKNGIKYGTVLNAD